MLFVLSACETPSGGLSPRSGEGRAERLAQNGEHEDAAGIYIGMASTSVGAERDRLSLLAAEQWLYAGDIARARNTLASPDRRAANSRGYTTAIQQHFHWSMATRTQL